MYFINTCSSCKVKLCLFQSPSSFFLNLKKTSHTSFCFFETSKLVSPQFLLFTLFCFREKNGEKTLQLTSINFVYMRLPDLRRIALRESPWRVAPEKQSLKQYNATISKYNNLIFCYVI